MAKRLVFRCAFLCFSSILVLILTTSLIGQQKAAAGKKAGAGPETHSGNQPEAAPQPSSANNAEPESPFAHLEYRFIGPPGNRVSAVVGEPGNSNVYYAGAASGGVWKSSDGGFNWSPVFDKEPAQSIGAIAVAPSNHSVVWVGTGETFIRSDVSIGNGVYKSTDAGKTWQHMGLDATGRIGRVIIDPHNPDVVYVAALGTCYGPQPERGVFRTRDGGKTWQRVLFVDENTGASGLAIDPKDSNTLFAGTWQIDIKTWGRNSGGPGSGVFVSHDGGDTWKHITAHGLPDSPLGKIDVAVAPNDSSRVYALIETGQRGSLWRSDDGGENWRLLNYSRLLNERPHYYTRMLVMPDNENEIYFPSNSMSVTYDGGQTADLIRWGGDNHDMWADPQNPNRMMIGSDGGVAITLVRGKQWHWKRLPIAQMYHVATDNRIPYYVYGQMQDGPSQRGPSNDLGGSNIPAADWTTTGGCETGWSTPDPADPNIVWAGCYAGVTERFDLRTGQARSVSVWPDRTMGANAGQVKIRMNWTYPIAISPHDHNTVYVGSQFVHKTSDGGQTWQTISPDLTLNDESMHGDSGGLTVDNLSVEYAGVVFALAESPAEKGQIWAGTNDGVVQVTRDGGAHWTNVTPKGMPAKMTVDAVIPSKYDAGTCYIAVDGHQVNIRDPYLYRTSDFGKSWRLIVNGIPKSPLSYTDSIQEDPVKRGLLYAGTENAIYVSFDDGDHWQPLQNNLPHAPVHWITVQEHFKDLVVGTYGRGFWILDDLTPLEQWSDSLRNDAVHLFPPRPAYRFREIFHREMAEGADGENPPYGASINYLLKQPAKKVEITVEGPDGTLIRRLKAENSAGINRTWWDLRYPSINDVELRTIPEGNAHIWEEKRFVGKDSRPVYYYGVGRAQSNFALRSPSGEPTLGPLVAPGTYTVKLVADGRTLTEKLTVLKDPNTTGSEADVDAATKLSLSIYNDANTSVRLINQLEWTRLQLQDMQKMLKAANADKSLGDSVMDLDGKALAIEDQLLQRTVAEGDLKSFRGPLQLYLKFVWLGAEVGSGGADVAGNPDFPPTQSEIDVYNLLHGQLEKAQTDFNNLYSQVVPAFNQTMQQKGMERLMTVQVK
ncbi:MAG: sialidase [Acidobacteria bacterium]|nr:sialidase [Acidobacteriota bacterium]